MLGEPAEIVVAAEAPPSRPPSPSMLEIPRRLHLDDDGLGLSRARTGCFYMPPQFTRDRAQWIALARSLVVCWDKRETRPLGGMYVPYRRGYVRQDFTLTLDLDAPRLELLQDFIFQCIADPDDSERFATGFDEAEHQRALAAHKFLTEAGAVPAINFSIVPEPEA